jgi:hypothetical protein
VQDIVVSMAFLAAWSMHVIGQQSLPVYTFHIIGQLLGMAVPAVYLIQVIGVWKSFIISVDMTRKAGIAMMDRMREYGSIHKHRYGSSM